MTLIVRANRGKGEKFPSYVVSEAYYEDHELHYFDGI